MCTVRFSRYELPFPAGLTTGGIFIYFNWLGLGLLKFSTHPWLQLGIFGVSVLLALQFLRYRPTFLAKSPIAEEGRHGFTYFGQGYFESIAIVTFGWMLNRIPCSPWIKLFVFVAAVPVIDFLFTRHSITDASEVSRYPDIGRP
jgi:hypothetical protein